MKNVNDADSLVPNMSYESVDGKLELGIGFNACLYSILLGIFAIIICILGGVWGYGMSGGSIGGIHSLTIA